MIYEREEKVSLSSPSIHVSNIKNKIVRSKSQGIQTSRFRYKYDQY